MIKLKNELQHAETVIIAGHVRPDGDSTGSCLAVYNYIREQFPGVDVKVYLETVNPNFLFLKGAEEIRTEYPAEESCDLFVSLDVSDKERLGKALPYFEGAKRTLCIDHHITNPGFADENLICADASSTSELVYEILDEEKISKETAEALYLGIVHDTGVFQYSNTTEKTMGIAGKLMADVFEGMILMPEPTIAIGAFLFSVVLGIIFGMYPAIKASGLQPVVALRAD